MYYIYWIHETTHNDPLTQGYIGISKEPEKRFKAHISNTAPVGSKQLRYMDDTYKASLVHTILNSVATLEEAQAEELRLRPTANIGWNVKRGGGTTPDCSGRTHSEQTKQDIARKNRITKSQRTYVSPFKGVTDRYTEETRALIGSYHKGKTISDEHKKAITEKNSGVNHARSKAVSVHDTYTGISTEYVNLTEASKALGVNYSTVRSAVQKGVKLVYKRYEIVEVTG